MFSESEACIDKMEMLWGKFTSLAIHLVPAIIGQRSWVAARENEKLSTQSPPLQFQNFNCIVHCETLGGKVLKMEHVMSIVLLTESFFLIPNVSITAKQRNPAPRNVPVVRTAPASVTGEMRANYADEECDHVDLQGKSRTITFLSYVLVFKWSWTFHVHKLQ